MDTNTHIQIAARTTTQIKIYPYWEPILEDTAILPGPRTTDAVINPGPKALMNFFKRWTLPVAFSGGMTISEVLAVSFNL